MLLQRLVEYGERIEPTPPLYAERAIRYIVELDGNGVPVSSEPTDTAVLTDRRMKGGTRRLAPQIQRTVAAKAAAHGG